ncbi:hypothetical protein CEXT_712781 [Caerostris extrusa]|uniref:Uncharacterized protein n=1 Tax=Caerostris extrusa TaxID=172846 RepID=A0AAV4RRH3_CAEEX|nr:hypothetical protein CEXT_712781 [Caerostris extrusa]
MARWDILQSSFPHVSYSLHDDFSLLIYQFISLRNNSTINNKQTKQPISQNASSPNSGDLSANECATCERVSPFTLLPAIVHRRHNRLSASVIRSLGSETPAKRRAGIILFERTRVKDNMRKIADGH